MKTEKTHTALIHDKNWEAKLLLEATSANRVDHFIIDITTGCIIELPSGIKRLRDMTEYSASEPRYDRYERIWSEQWNIPGTEEFLEMCNCKFLKDRIAQGFMYSEVNFDIVDDNSNVHPLRQIFFMGHEDITGHYYAVCFLYDNSEYAQHLHDLAGLKEELREARLQNSLGQIKPHFLYNTLASIRQIILENPVYAADLMYDFTKHLRACLKYVSDQSLISFTQELDNIRAYLNIEKMRFGDVLAVEYDLNELDFLVAPLTIQPLVENAVRHGVFGKGQEGGTVRIATERVGDSVHVTVSDNGIGFDIEKLRKDIQTGKKDSTGLENIRFRLKHLQNATLDIRSTPGCGTYAVVIIPMENELPDGVKS